MDDAATATTELRGDAAPIDTEEVVLRTKIGRRIVHRLLVVPTAAEQVRIALDLHHARAQTTIDVLGWKVVYRPSWTSRIGIGDAKDPFKPAHEQPPPIWEWHESEVPAYCTFGCKQEWSVEYSWCDGPDQPPVVASTKGDILPRGAVVIQESLFDRKPPPVDASSESTDAVLLEAPEILVEGARRSVEGDAVERNPEARRRCISHYGALCFVCVFDFGEFYGDARAVGFVHVHHLFPISESTGERVVDPIRDLRPLCANCHCFVHLFDPPRDVEEARSIIAARRSPPP